MAENEHSAPFQANHRHSLDERTSREEEAPLIENGVVPKRVSPTRSSLKMANIYANPLPEGEDDKPVLRVQFDSDNISDTSTVKQPPFAAASILSTSSSSSSSSSSSGGESIAVSEARPPDGGWGWVVVFAAFVVNLIADGITFSFGVIFVEFLNYFGENRGTTAWVGGLFMAMPLLSGPVASFLTDRYGCRRVTVCGAVMASVGFVVSSQANSMAVLCVTFGILSGFGLSLCYVASVVIVAYYFDKKRSLATGLSVCGSGIGTFIFAPLIQLLLDEYGWRGTTLILAGLFLNLVVCGCLMRDLPWTSQKLKSQARERKRTRHLKRRNRGCSVDAFSVGNGAPEEAKEKEEKLYSSLVTLPTYLRNGERVPAEVLELLARHDSVFDVLVANYPHLLPQEAARGGAAARRRAPKRAYLRDLRIHRLSLTYRGAMLNIRRYRLRASSCPDIYKNSMTTIAEEEGGRWYAGLWDFWDLLVDMFDFSHFGDPKFSAFALSNFLLYTWYDVPYVYLADYARENGFSDKQASLLISVIGIVNMAGEIILGWAGDRSWANEGIIYAACMSFCGVIVALVPLVTGYDMLLTLAGAFGFFIAANYSLTCIILVELISLDRFTNAYGLLLLVQGVANLIGPPLAGWIFDITSTYNLSFYLSGLFIAISGLILIVIPASNYYKKTVSGRRSAAAAEISLESPRVSETFDKFRESVVAENEKSLVDKVHFTK